MKLSFLKPLLIFSLVLITFSLMAQSSSAGRDGSVGSIFWGTSTGWGACGPSSSGDGTCFQGEYSQYFVFWIATGPEQPTGSTRSCDCAQAGTAPQTTIEP